MDCSVTAHSAAIDSRRAGSSAAEVGRPAVGGASRGLPSGARAPPLRLGLAVVAQARGLRPSPSRVRAADGGCAPPGSELARPPGPALLELTVAQLLRSGARSCSARTRDCPRLSWCPSKIGCNASSAGGSRRLARPWWPRIAAFPDAGAVAPGTRRCWASRCRGPCSLGSAAMRRKWASASAPTPIVTRRCCSAAARRDA